MAYPPKVFPPLGEIAAVSRGQKSSILASLEGAGCVRRWLDKDLGAQYINYEFQQDQSL